ncbi:hypothetical protein [Ammoniphilus sp. YIM 78166]|uniref:hypothetical protein n=1 Tax=Ammoniphilus sp. YIM 78166 TaxID=1644106 RepID=UPI0014322719|nr:hypothetical protein [Ammoniphilus sp. YIM 78166]
MSKGVKKFMKLFAKNLKESRGPGRFQANGIDIVCVHCQHDLFEQGQAQLNTALLS